MIKVGTVKELSRFEKVIDRDVHSVALRIVTMLDEVYGADRDVDNNDGGFVLIAENVQDIADIGQRYVRLDDNRHEAVNVVKCKNRTYIISCKVYLLAAQIGFFFLINLIHALV